MDRREIEDVEAHLFGVIDPPKAIAKGRSTIGPTLSGAGEEFVPGGGASRDAIDDHMRWRGVLSGALSRRVGGHQDFEFAGMDEAIDLGIITGAYPLGELAQPFGISATGAFGRGGKQTCAFQFFARQVGEPGLEFCRVFMLPAGKDIGPSFDRIFVGRIFINGKDAAPAIVIDEFHGCLVPVGLA